jgi:Tol biopolymer transport system component
MSNLKKILIGIALLVIVGGAGYGVYYVFFKAPAPEVVAPVANVNAPVGGALPGAGPAGARPTVPTGGTGVGLQASPIARGGFTLSPVVVNTPTLGATLTADGSGLNFYDRATGQFFRVNPDGSLTQLSADAFPQAQNVTWSSNGARVVLEFPDGSKIAYDFNAQRQATLPKSWEDFSFSPDSNQIAAKSVGDSPDANWLVVSDADGNNPRVVNELGDNSDKVQVSWSPTGEVIALSQTGDPVGGGGKQVLFVGQNGENFKSVISPGLAFTPNWSPDGARMLFSAAAVDDDWKPRISIVDAQGDNIGGERRTIDLYTTADKCTWANAGTVYCAVPDYMPDGAGLQLNVLDGTPDAVYRVDTTTGAITLVGRPESDATMERLSVSPDGSILYFVDQTYGTIKKMQLK